MTQILESIGAFQELGRLVGIRWKQCNYDEKAFPAIATELLVAARLPERVDPSDIVRWLCTNDSLPAQGDRGEFGEPPIVVYRGRRFYIELIFWLDGTTSVHQHAFSGAFGVLVGESLETSYELQNVRRVNSRLLLCDVQAAGVRLLRAGDVHDIVAGEPGAHSLFHLARPSVSVVIRTVNDVEAQPQYLYLKPFVAIDPFLVDSVIDRRRRAIEALFQTDHAHALEIARSAIEASDLELAFHLLRGLYALGGYSTGFGVLAETARARHGEVIDRFIAVFAEQAREESIVRMRRTVHDPDLRFFLALLLNVPARKMVVQLVRERFPAADPAEKIEAWLRRLSDESVLGFEFDEVAAELYRLLCVPKSLDEVLEHVNRQVDNGSLKATGRRVMQQYSQLRSSPLLRPLLPTRC